jgi:hypothetical protein
MALTITTSCDAGVRLDLWCDACDARFDPPPDTPPDADAVWHLAQQSGWDGGATHHCPDCTRYPVPG